MSNNRSDEQQPEVIEILDPVLRQGFAQLPRAILKAPKLSRNAKCLYALLLDYAWQEGSCFPGQARLAEDLGVTDRTIRTDLKELREFGLIDWKQRGMNKTNVYYILALAKNARLNLGTVISELDRKNSSSPERKDSSAHERKFSSDIIDSDYYTQTDIDTDKHISKGIDPVSHNTAQSPEGSPPRSGGLTPIRQTIQQRQAKLASSTRGRPPKAHPAIEAYFTDFSIQMHDSEHTKSNITQAMRLFRSSGLEIGEFMSLAWEARAITNDRSGSITKEAGEWGVKNRIPYFFSVFRDKLGMKEDSNLIEDHNIVRHQQTTH